MFGRRTLKRSGPRPTGGGISDLEIEVDGYPIRYKVAGMGEPVVLVHGLSGSTRSWTQNVPALAERYRVYLVDLPGFGAMRRPRRRFVLSEAASWLLDWMVAADLKQAHLVGHSMGGYVCLRLAASNPEVVRQLVLVNPAGLPTDRSLLGHLVPLLAAARHLPLRFLPTLAYDAFSMGPTTLWRAARDLLGEDVREDLRSIVAPTLLIWGQNDSLIPPALGDLLREEIPDSRLLILGKAGHAPMFERPQEFNAALLAFLAGEPVGK